MRKKTQKEFIEECLKAHGTKYGLEKAVYCGYLKKVLITCPVHGDFEIRADHFLHGDGCHKCAKEKANKHLMLTNNEFIERAAKTHNNKYVYEKCEYNGLSKNVVITCPIHGDFKQRAGNHLNGCGCPKCGREEANLKQAMPFETFKEKANKIHNSKYEYIENTYTSAKNKVEIVCPIHGCFRQQGWAHLNGEGCPKCGKESRLLVTVAKTLTDFIKDANIVHNNFYSYNKTVYVNNYTKAIFTCPVHGDFKQTPHQHLRGCGCPKCKTSNLEKKVIKFLDNNNIEYIHQASKAHLNWLGQQRLDFYLPNEKIAIECNGVQHYKPVDFAGKGEDWAIKKFEYTQKLDEDKRIKCVENGITLEYIKYNDNVEKRLNEIKNVKKN